MWMTAKEKGYSNEDELRRLLCKDPSIIPVEELGFPKINVMIDEVAVDSNSIDLIGIDREGNIYIIETKLARNEEIRRKVIGQVLEYASLLWNKDVQWLEDEIRKRHGDVKEIFKSEKDWDFEQFEIKLNNNLKGGSFKLIITVDKIDDTLKRIVEYMQKILEAEIYVLELKYYKENDIEVLVPDLHSKTVGPPLVVSWNWPKFRETARRYLDEDQLTSIESFYKFIAEDLTKNYPVTLTWGSGEKYGTFQLRLINGKRVVTFGVNGSVEVAFGNLYPENDKDEMSKEKIAAIDSFAQKLYDKGFLDRRISYQNYNEPGNKYPIIFKEDLFKKMEDFKQIIKQFLTDMETARVKG